MANVNWILYFNFKQLNSEKPTENESKWHRCHVRMIMSSGISCQRVPCSPYQGNINIAHVTREYSPYNWIVFYSLYCCCSVLTWLSIANSYYVTVTNWVAWRTELDERAYIRQFVKKNCAGVELWPRFNTCHCVARSEEAWGACLLPSSEVNFSIDQ